ncbi:MAG: c-type cytochrome [Beijerinckiaceae bacterium]|nr:c-type cytochrome [Beijerinckiaceae bacterium]
MTHVLRTATPSVLFVLSLVFAQSALSADAANGDKLAKRWCADCHVVWEGQPRAQADAPTFASISASRRVPEISSFLRQSHPQMPDMNLSRGEIADLIAYMHTLAPPIEPAPASPAKDDYKPPSRG